MKERATAYALYKKLLRLYPRGFRDQVGESMRQTFNDLYLERKRQSGQGLFGFVAWTFIETFMGIIKEHILLLAQEDSMKNIIANAKSAAFTSVILSMPMALTSVIFLSDIEVLTKPYQSLLIVNGYDLNVLGHIVLKGGLLLLPVAFVLNLLPMLKKEGLEQKRIPHPVNLIVGIIIFVLIIFIWGALALESIYCLQGIRCD